MRPMVKRWLGYDRPKQYCTFVGRRSMLEHTLARATQLMPPRQVVTVIGQGHSAYLNEADTRPLPGTTIEQPEARGTLPGILLAATQVKAVHPSATLLVLPSDHFIFPEARFLHCASVALRRIEGFGDRILLFGVRPEGPEPEYGWIEHGNRLGATPVSACPLFSVRRFREKPSAEEARVFFRSGYLCNTLMMVVKVEILWNLAQEFFPDLHCRFETLLRVLQSVRRGEAPPHYAKLARQTIYRGMEKVDFSAALLERVARRILVLQLHELEWSDWGRPVRIAESLLRIGRRPLFPLELDSRLQKSTVQQQAG